MAEKVRLAQPEDAERVREVIHEAYALIRELNLHWPAAHADTALVRDNIAENDCYVIEVDGVIAGTITLSRTEEARQFTDLPFLKWFAVHPEYQGKGIGGRLLDHVEREIVLGRHGAPAVTLATAEKHPWLLPMYERRGYERFIAFDPGNGDGTIHLLRKILDPGRFGETRAIGGDRRASR
jgi:predicted N-acetyltransferase YhbS